MFKKYNVGSKIWYDEQLINNTHYKNENVPKY